MHRPTLCSFAFSFTFSAIKWNFNNFNIRNNVAQRFLVAILDSCFSPTSLLLGHVPTSSVLKFLSPFEEFAIHRRRWSPLLLPLKNRCIALRWSRHWCLPPLLSFGVPSILLPQQEPNYKQLNYLFSARNWKYIYLFAEWYVLRVWLWHRCYTVLGYEWVHESENNESFPAPRVHREFRSQWKCILCALHSFHRSKVTDTDARHRIEEERNGEIEREREEFPFSRLLLYITSGSVFACWPVVCPQRAQSEFIESQRPRRRLLGCLLLLLLLLLAAHSTGFAMVSCFWHRMVDDIATLRVYRQTSNINK